jgi:hypothetical protein
MTCKIIFKGFTTISIKRISEDEIELTLPILLQPKITGLEIGKAIEFSIGSLSKGLSGLFSSNSKKGS